MTSSRRVVVDLGPRSYTIYIGRGNSVQAGEIFVAHCGTPRACLITETRVARHLLTPILHSLRHSGIEVTPLIFPPGERQKSLSRATSLFRQLREADLPRAGVVIALGGGVVGDLAGFVAATYRRGVRLVHIPTTLLAQTESSIGGKTAVNLGGGKNVVGAYHQPRFVLSDIQLLRTLPHREIICALGEIAKYAYLSHELFAGVAAHLDKIVSRDEEAMEEIVTMCAVHKAGLIEEDEREENPGGGRMVLNLGHTIGHALESLSEGSILHGEAVITGLRLELEIARAASIIEPSAYEALSGLLKGIPYTIGLHRALLAEVPAYLYRSGKNPDFILPAHIGTIISTNAINQPLVVKVLNEFR